MKRGYAIVVTVLIMSLGLISISFLLNSVFKSALVQKNSIDSIQADYNAESAIEMVTSAGNFENAINDLYVKREYTDKVEIFGSEVDIKGIMIGNRPPKFEIKAETSNKNITSNWYAYGNIVNEIYTTGESVVSPRTCNVNGKVSIDELQKMKSNIGIGNTKNIILPAEDIYLHKEGSSIAFFRDSEFKEKVDSVSSFDRFYLEQNDGNLIVLSDIKAMALFNVENIILGANIKINGILNLKSDIQSLGDYNIEVDGLTLNYDQVSENYIVANYNYDKLHMFHKNFKDFIKPTVKYTSKEKK